MSRFDKSKVAVTLLGALAFGASDASAMNSGIKKSVSEPKSNFSASIENRESVEKITDVSELSSEVTKQAFYDAFKNAEEFEYFNDSDKKLVLEDAFRSIIRNFKNPDKNFEYECYKYSVNSTPVSYVMIEIFYDHIQIDRLFTDPKFQGKGYGSKLLRHVMSISDDKNIKAQLLSSGAGKRLYTKYMKEEKQGFFVHYPGQYLDSKAKL